MSAREELERLLPKNERGEVLYPLIYDLDLMRPGCVLLQVFGGCLPDFDFIFPGETWLLSPTPGMRKIMVTMEEAKKLAKKSKGRSA